MMRTPCPTAPEEGSNQFRYDRPPREGWQTNTPMRDPGDATPWRPDAGPQSRQGHMFLMTRYGNLSPQARRDDEPSPPPEREQPGLGETILRVPVFLKIIVANGVIAAVAGVLALLLVEGVTGSPLGGTAALSVAIFVVAVVALTTLLNGFVVRLALSPLALLAETAERVRQGNLSARVPLSRLADSSTRSLVILFNRTMDTLQAGRRRQRELSRRILGAEERERERIAHELYAGPAQSLAGVMVRLHLVSRLREGGSSDHPDLYQEIRDEVAEALEEVRSLARRLRPPELDELGVRAALEAHARSLTEDRDITVSVKGEPCEKGLPAETVTALFRILQEAVTNSVVHSGAHTVEILFAPGNGHLVAEVIDDGHGFDPVGLFRTPQAGVGISGMQERAAYAGGTATVASRTGGGTRVRVELPWEGAPWDDEARPQFNERRGHVPQSHDPA